MQGQPKVLVIDDSSVMHSIIQSQLSAEGVQIHSALSGEDGIRLANAIGPDVILLDVEMPAPNGFEVCRRLKSTPELSYIPVIFLSGLSSTDEKVRGLNLGAIDYITKPCDPAELQARVRASLRNKELFDLLSRKAMVDGLTGLYNRSYLNQRLDEELAFARRHKRAMACIMTDIDHFKSINDTHGHGFGDVVLRGFSDLIQRTCRAEDVVCRYGGEEFAVLSRETDALTAMRLADRLRTAVEAATFSRGAIRVSLTCSLGVSSMLEGGTAIIDLADQALYSSKNMGRNRATLA